MWHLTIFNLQFCQTKIVMLASSVEFAESEIVLDSIAGAEIHCLDQIQFVQFELLPMWRRSEVMSLLERREMASRVERINLCERGTLRGHTKSWRLPGPLQKGWGCGFLPGKLNILIVLLRTRPAVAIHPCRENILNNLFLASEFQGPFIRGCKVVESRRRNNESRFEFCIIIFIVMNVCIRSCDLCQWSPIDNY